MMKKNPGIFQKSHQAAGGRQIMFGNNGRIDKICHTAGLFFGRFDENSGPTETQVFAKTQVKIFSKLRFSGIFK